MLSDDTFEALSDIDNSPLANLPTICMKHINKKSFGFILRDDIDNDEWVIYDYNGRLTRFENVQDLVDNGWLVD